MCTIEKILAVLSGIVVLFGIAMAAIQPYFEARTFNRFSLTKATYWDAVFADLRVIPDGEPR